MRNFLAIAAAFAVAAAPSAQSLADAEIPADADVIEVQADAVTLPALEADVDLSNFVEAPNAEFPMVDPSMQDMPVERDEKLGAAYWGSVGVTAAGLGFLAYLMFG